MMKTLRRGSVAGIGVALCAALSASTMTMAFAQDNVPDNSDNPAAESLENNDGGGAPDGDENAALTDSSGIDADELGFVEYAPGDLEGEQAEQVKSVYNMLWTEDNQNVHGEFQNDRKSTGQVAQVQDFLDYLTRESPKYQSFSNNTTNENQDLRAEGLAAQQLAVATYLAYLNADTNLDAVQANHRTIYWGDRGIFDGNGAVNEDNPHGAAVATTQLLEDGESAVSDVAFEPGKTLHDYVDLQPDDQGYAWGDRNGSSQARINHFYNQAAWMIATGFDEDLYMQSPENAIGANSQGDTAAAIIQGWVSDAENGDNPNFVSDRVEWASGAYRIKPGAYEGANISENPSIEDGKDFAALLEEEGTSGDAKATIKSYQSMLENMASIANDPSDADGWSDLGLKAPAGDDDDAADEDNRAPAPAPAPEANDDDDPAPEESATDNEGNNGSGYGQNPGASEALGVNVDPNDAATSIGDANEFFAKGREITAVADAEWVLFGQNGQKVTATEGDVITIVELLSFSVINGDVEATPVDSFQDANLVVISQNGSEELMTIEQYRLSTNMFTE